MPKDDKPMRPGSVQVRITVDGETDARIEKWASSERRGKAAQIEFLLRQLAVIHRDSPELLRDLGLMAGVPRRLPSAISPQVV